jgi:hypothetical protein
VWRTFQIIQDFFAENKVDTTRRSWTGVNTVHPECSNSRPPQRLAEIMSAATANLPNDVERAVLVAYRSIGLGIWGAALRFAGMPLEVCRVLPSFLVLDKNPQPSHFDICPMLCRKSLWRQIVVE